MNNRWARHAGRLLLATMLSAGWLAAGAAAQSTLSQTWAPYREPPQRTPLDDAQASVAPPVEQQLVERELADVRAAARLQMGVVSAQAVCEVPCQQPCEAICQPQSVMGAAPVVIGNPVMAAPAAGVVIAPAPYVNNNSPAQWQWRLLPSDVAWQSYWAGAHESRLGFAAFWEEDDTGYLDATLGGRAALVRYGTEGGNGQRPLGWELQVEGAALPRLNLDNNWDLDAADFRAGVPLIYARENWQWKLAYYHLSSHMGDEYAIRTGNLAQRINYSRDTIVTAISFYPLPAWRWYAEAGWAFYTDGGSQPFEFQFGLDLAKPGRTGGAGTPFFAINGHLREEHDFGGNLSVQAGWLWRGPQTKVLRMGVHYYNGKSNQFQFFDQFEQQIGGGVWYDF